MCRLALPGAVRSVLTQPCGSGLPGKGRVLACGVGWGAHLRVWGARSLTSPVFSQAHGVAVAVEVGEVTHRSPSLPASGGPVLPPRRAVSLDSRATHPHRRGQACVRMGREVPGRRLWDKGGGRNSCRWGWRSRALGTGLALGRKWPDFSSQANEARARVHTHTLPRAFGSQRITLWKQPEWEQRSREATRGSRT